MVRNGDDVIEIGSTRVGQKYVFGANVPLNNAAWKGPWDCAEFVSWCVYQAYGEVFGAGRPKTIDQAEPFSGHWHDEARKYGIVVDWRAALKIPGAVLIRKPAPGLIGHVALSLGDGDRTLEARSTKLGVGIFDGAAARGWTVGCLLPGVEYGAFDEAEPTAATTMPDGYLWLKTPRFKGAAVVALQKGLKARGVDPGAIDGEFGPMVQAAVISFQALSGLEVDGIVGPGTAARLGLSFPIAPAAADIAGMAKVSAPATASVSRPATSGAVDTVVAVTARDGSYEARTKSGFTFLVGRATPFTDDMKRLGLFQGKKEIADSLQFGVFEAQAFEGEFGQWAYLISPTLEAEGRARFATLNTYDRAAFTFGAPQFAAHTPGDNFVNYFRRLLALPNAADHFPDLALKPNAAGRTTIHRVSGGTSLDLEQPVLVTRPNGKKDMQLQHLMRYLNPSPTVIDGDELLAAARLMNWLRLDSGARSLQVALFIEQSRARLARAKARLPGFSGTDWRAALWINDILHQGRGTFLQMEQALTKPDPIAALGMIGGAAYPHRVKTVSGEIVKLAAGGKLKGFVV